MSSSPTSESIHLDDALKLLEVGWFHYRLLFMCGLAFMAHSIEITLISFLSVCVKNDWDLTNNEVASLGSAVFGGILIGYLFWGPFADKFGRRKAFICGSFAIISGSFLTAIAPNYMSLLIIRAIVGFGVGSSAIPFDLLAEFLPNSHRGLFLIYIEYFWTFGSIFVVLIAWISLELYSWRLFSLLAAIPVSLSLLLAIVYLPESPRWLLAKGRKHEAEEVLQHALLLNATTPHKNKDEKLNDTRKSNNIGNDSNMTTDGVLHVSNALLGHGEHQTYTSTSVSTSRTLPSARRGSSSQTHPSSITISLLEMEQIEDVSWTYFFKPKMLKISIPLWLLWFCFGLAYYGIVLLITKINETNNDDDGDDGDDDNSNTCSFDYIAILTSALVEALGVFLVSLYIDRWGRKPSQILFYVLTGIALLLMIFPSKHYWFVVLTSVARMCSMASSCATWVAAPELFPTAIRATGHSIAGVMSEFGAFASPFVVSGSASKETIGIVFATFNFIAALCCVVLPETAGKDMNEPDDNYEDVSNGDDENSKLTGSLLQGKRLE